MKKNLLAIALLLALPPRVPAAAPADFRAQADKLVAQMTLEEKASLCSGLDWWSTKPIPRLGIPSITMRDGPHGLRRSSGSSMSEADPATCFPTASALASSWDVALARRVGEALGRETQAAGVQLLLGPGVNMKRSPLGGRNFEYFSEDPVLSGRLAVAFIEGVQSQGVGTSLKHFAANNQEFQRHTMNADVDERTLREIYLPAFELAVKEAQPWSVMCAYNKVNGTYASENPRLLDEILKQQWGFAGFVVSDWGAVNSRPAGVAAGLHLEMPASAGINDRTIVAAVRAGALSEARLDTIVAELLAVVLRADASRRPGTTFDPAAHHTLAREVAGQCLVLLKNAGVLPLDLKKTKRLALIGAFAKAPRIQGSGSSRVKPTQLSTAFDELRKLAGDATQLTYAPGYDEDGATTDALLADAQQQARAADVAIVFAGLPDSYESEGYDRDNISLPVGHDRLVDAVAGVQPNTVVVLMNGSAVAMPWAGRVPAILEAWLTGQAGGGAIADVLTGRVNPTGKLSETFPARLEDTPAFPDFPGRNGTARYGEGVFVGYRYYDTKKIAPLFPFGHGLSYTTFVYEELHATTLAFKDTDGVDVSVAVSNTGPLAGREVVQLYVHEQAAAVARPEQELKRFAKVALAPGEKTVITFHLAARDFAYWDARVHDWSVHPGRFDVLVGGSSRDLPLRQTLELSVPERRRPKLTLDSTLNDFADHPEAKAVHDELAAILMRSLAGEAPANLSAADQAARRLVSQRRFRSWGEIPVIKFTRMRPEAITEAKLREMLARIPE